MLSKPSANLGMIYFGFADFSFSASDWQLASPVRAQLQATKALQ